MFTMIRTTILLTFLSAFAYAQKESDDFTGRWKAPKGDLIRIHKTKSGFIGKTVKEGVVVLKDVKFTNGKWTAVIMNPKENLIADCELKLEHARIQIIAKKGPFQRTLYWVKA